MTWVCVWDSTAVDFIWFHLVLPGGGGLAIPELRLMQYLKTILCSCNLNRLWLIYWSATQMKGKQLHRTWTHVGAHLAPVSQLLWKFLFDTYQNKKSGQHAFITSAPPLPSSQLNVFITYAIKITFRVFFFSFFQAILSFVCGVQSLARGHSSRHKRKRQELGVFYRQVSACNKKGIIYLKKKERN